MAEQAEKRLTVDIKEASEMIGISESFCRKLANKGQIPGTIKFGSKTVFSRYQLEKYLNGEASG